MTASAISLVDVTENAALAEKLRVTDIPALVLVKDRRVVDRLEGRVSAPKIERMLEPYLAGDPVAVP